MDVSTFPLRLADGRTLEVSLSGPDGGTPLVYHDGTPSGGRPYGRFVAAAAARGLRLLSYARPGYASSTRQPGRRVADCAADVAALLDHLGADLCYTAGASGGGPHALACAALLPDRVLACATIAGAAPFDAEGLDPVEGMGEENVKEYGAAMAGPEQLEAYIEGEARAYATVTGGQVADALGGLVSQVDRAALSGDFADHVAASFRQALSNGIWGWFDDDLAFARPWGFELDGLRVPVTVWQGGQDRMVPFAHGEWLAAHLPGARAMLLPSEGHLSIAVAKFGEVVDDLLESAPEP
jgi:pimeloyl-ACP methyl ester carboxylesterase